MIRTKLEKILPQGLIAMRGADADFEVLTFFNVKAGWGRDPVPLFSVRAEHLFDMAGWHFDLTGIDEVDH